MGITKRKTPFEPLAYYGLVEDIVEPEKSNYLRTYLLLDCIQANNFDAIEIAGRAEPQALALIRVMSTRRRLNELFDFDNLAIGDWVEIKLSDDGGRPRAWRLTASSGYEPAPPFSVLSIRRLSDATTVDGAAEAKMPSRLSAFCKSFAGQHSRATAVDFGQQFLASGGDDLEIKILDVGQASATLISRNGDPIGFCDVGAPVWWNQKSFPKKFTAPKLSKGFVVLSHWDFDHFDLGRRRTEYHSLDWYAPDQKVGPNTAKFQSELGSQLKFIDGGYISGRFTFERATSTSPNDRNGSGYLLRYDGAKKSILLTGDADYSYVPNHMSADLGGVAIPHHGGKISAPPPAPFTADALAIASYGVPNSYHHPSATTLSQHASSGWDVQATAADGATPRGDRLIYP